MAATARKLDITKEDLSGGSGGAFAELEVPNDYEAVLASVEDYDYTARGKSMGWLFTFNIPTPSGKEVALTQHVAFTPDSRWKLVSILDAFGIDLSEGVNDVDPNSVVGMPVGVHIDFPRDDDGEPTSKYREIQDVFSLVKAPTSVEQPEVAVF